MIRNGILLLLLAFGLVAPRADAQSFRPDCNIPCVFETLWQEIVLLEDKDRRRLEPHFLQAVAVSRDPALIDTWERKLGETAEIAAPYENYALMKVSRFIEAEGWQAFFSRAELRQRPFNTGRPEMMAAAAEHLADPETAQRIYVLMETYAQADRSEAAFERASFGHVLAEAAMRRCDLVAFDRALNFTDAPDALRYAVWRTRMAGRLADVLIRLETAPQASHAMYVRQVTDGLSDVLALKTCAINDESL